MRATSLLVLALGLAVQACSSGSGGSDVGAHPGVAPTARPQVLNGGSSGTFRSGSEVLMTGKASEDGDGPLITWHWRQTDGLPVNLIEANTTTVSFTAPDVVAPAFLAFELTVEDSTGDTGRATVDVAVVPARDSDKFLSLDVRTGSTFDAFKIVAALAGGAQTGSTAKPFTLSAHAYLVYPPRTAPDADCGFDAVEFAGGMPDSIASGCRVVWLEDLTPQPLAAGGTGISGEWPAGVHAPDEPETERLSRWWNPRLSVSIPRLDVREFNQQFVDRGERDLLLDSFAAHRARIVLELTLTAPENQLDATMILTDLGNVPITLPDRALAKAFQAGSKAIANDGTGLPTSAIVPLEALLAAIAGREAALTAEVYYRTVDPTGTRATLNGWLRQAGSAASDDGTLLPDAVAGAGEFAHAVYLNNFDLGFGRQMYTRTDEFGNVFSFVKNYSTLEAAIRGLDSFVTVVMEFSPLLNHTDPTPKFVKFFTYIEDGSGDAPRVASFDFDGRGERFTPGNCTSCHGGARPPGVAELVFDGVCGDPLDAMCYAWPASNRNGDGIANGDLQATFLPWDLESLLFADSDPAITDAPVPFDGVTLGAELARDYGDFSRSAQEGQLSKLNQAAYDTYVTPRTDAVRRLLESWYGGVDQNGDLLAATFTGGQVAPGWRNGELVADPLNPAAMLVNPNDAAEIYHHVYAQHCRMCHTSMLDETLRFDTYQEFIAQEEAIRRTAFRIGIMPAARLTMDRFWSPFHGGLVPGELLAGHIAILDGEAPLAAPGAPAADIAGLTPPPHRGDTVFLDGTGSAFAERHAWTLTPPTGSAAKLVGGDTPYPTFVVDVPGTYDVSLTVDDGTTIGAAVTIERDVANRPPTAANDLFSLSLPEASVLHGSVLAGAHQDSDPDADTLTAALLAGGLPMHGQVVLNADGAFVYTYSGDSLAPPSHDIFRYEVADGFGGTAEGTATILLSAAPAQERPTAPTLMSVVDASTTAGSASAFKIDLHWLASSDDDQVTGYRVYRDGSLLELVPSTAPPGAAVLYTDVTAEPDTTHTYRITALDGTNESPLSSVGVTTVGASLRRSIQTGWGAGADSLWRVSGCIGCHRGAPGGLTLSGAADAIFAELTEDAADASRRIDVASPADSLILCKPLIKTDPRSCPHGGGAFLVRSAPAYQALLRWISREAPNN